MPQDEYAALQKELTDAKSFRAQVETERAAAEAQRIKILADKGQSDEALRQQREGYEAKLTLEREEKTRLEGELFGYLRDSVVGQALEGAKFVNPYAAAHVRKLLSEEVEVTRDTQGNPIVRDRKTMRPAADYLKERLSSPEFAHCFEANTRGGTGGGAAQFPGSQATNGNNGNDLKSIMNRTRSQFGQPTH